MDGACDRCAVHTGDERDIISAGLEGVSPDFHNKRDFRAWVARASFKGPALDSILFRHFVVVESTDTAETLGSDGFGRGLGPLEQLYGLLTGKGIAWLTFKGSRNLPGLCAGASVEIRDEIANGPVTGRA